MSKLSSISNFFYTKPSSVNRASFQYKDAEGSDKNGSAVTVTAGKVTRTVIFDPDKTHYQILKPSNLKSDERLVVLEGKRLADEPKQVAGSISLNGWVPVKGDALADDEAINTFAKTVVEQAINFKAVRFAKWSAHSISNVTYAAYNNPTVAKAVKYVGATLIVCSGLYYWKQASCATAFPETQRAVATSGSFISRLIFNLRLWLEL